jgi:predicted PurR-regulated permease PerM
MVLLVPSVVIVLTLAGDVKEFATTTASWVRQGPLTPPEWIGKVPWVGETIVTSWNAYAADSKQFFAAAEQFIDPLTSWILTIGKALGHGVLELSLSMFLAFFFFRDGAKLGDRAIAVARRLAGDRGEHLLREVAGGTIRGVVYGILGTAMAQGFLAWIGFSVAGVPAAVLLGLMTFLISAIPMGPPLIWIPASIWVFQTGSVGMGIFMLLWGALAVSSVDNFIRPLIISKGNQMPFVLIFMGVLGGGLAFGLIGIFLGPTLLAVSFRLSEEWLAYRKEVTEIGAASPQIPTP